MNQAKHQARKPANKVALTIFAVVTAVMAWVGYASYLEHQFRKGDLSVCREVDLVEKVEGSGWVKLRGGYTVIKTKVQTGDVVCVEHIFFWQ
nr:hypothetical protein BdHM001_36520 [Bdellovibrio sp. HM001]